MSKNIISYINNYGDKSFEQKKINEKSKKKEHNNKIRIKTRNI